MSKLWVGMRGQRRSRLRLAVAGVAAVAAVGLTASSVMGASTGTGYWLQPQGDSALSNHNTNETALTPTSLGILEPEFSMAGTPEFNYCIRGIHTPVANATTLFVADGTGVTAVNLATGRQLWRTTITAAYAVATNVALSGTTLIVGEVSSCYEQSDPDGRIEGYSTTTGKLLWSQAFDLPVVTMVVSGSTILDSGDEFDGYTALEARNVMTGALIWSDDDCYGAFVIGTEVLSSCGAVALTTGVLQWSKPGWTFWRADGPGVTNPQIYATDPSGHLTALNAKGAVVWSSTTEKGPVLAAGPNRIYATCDTNALCALNRTTGVRQWKDPYDNPKTVALAGNVAYPMPEDEPLNVDTGAQIDTDYLDFSHADAAQVSNGHLLVETGRILDVYSLQCCPVSP